MRALLIASLLLQTSLSFGKKEGRVVQVTKGEVMLDLGNAQGLKPGDTLEFYRRLVVKHPVSKKSIEDRFPIGRVVVHEVGQLLSILRAPKGLKRPPALGDYVRIWSKPKETPAPKVPTP